MDKEYNKPVLAPEPNIPQGSEGQQLDEMLHELQDIDSHIHELRQRREKLTGGIEKMMHRINERTANMVAGDGPRHY